MKNKFLLLSIVSISALSIFSCKDEEETSTPSIVGTWEMTKINAKVYIGGTKFLDTNLMPPLGSSSIAVIKEDKSIMRIDTEESQSDTIIGTYNITGTKIVLNLVDPKDGPFTEEYEDLTYNAAEMNFTKYDPNKTSPNRSEYTLIFKRK